MTRVVLAIGPMPPPLGGTTCSFSSMVDWMKEIGYRVNIIDTCYADKLGLGFAPVKFLHLFFSLIRKIAFCDVVFFNASDRLFFTCAPLVSLICKVFGKKIVFRQFGGEFLLSYAALSRCYKAVFDKQVLRHGHQFYQTKEIFDFFRGRSSNPVWFPTARRMQTPRAVVLHRGDVLRCVYVGSVSVAKGVLVAKAAFNELSGVAIDIYGHLEDLTLSDVSSNNVNYVGVADNSQIGEILRKYEVFVFPSFYHGEGYSGAVIEAGLSGLSLVLSRWKALPEMYDEQECIFVEPQSVRDLTDAIVRLRDDPDLRRALAERSLLRSKDYSFEKQIEVLKQILG